MNSRISKKLKSHFDQVSDLIFKSSYNDNRNISALTGFAARIIFNQSNPSEKQNKQQESDIIQGLAIINEAKVSSNFVDGISGFGCCLAMVFDSTRFNSDQESYFKELDYLIFSKSKEKLLQGNFDFFYGLGGYIVYFLERIEQSTTNSTRAQQCLERLVETLKNQPINRIIKERLENEKEVLFGLAHGLSGQIVLLTKIIKLGIEVDFCTNLANYLVGFIFRYQSESIDTLRFPSYIENGTPYFGALRWCHSDLGVAFALLFFGTTIKDKRIIDSGNKTALTLSGFHNAHDQELYSATVCHGTLGVATMFAKLATYSEYKEELKQCEYHWLGKSIEIMESKVGYKYFDDDGKFKLKSGILYGIEGIGLSLKSCLTEDHQPWKNSILLM